MLAQAQRKCLDKKLKLFLIYITVFRDELRWGRKGRGLPVKTQSFSLLFR